MLQFPNSQVCLAGWYGVDGLPAPLFPLDKKDVVCYTSVSGFIFLRFFAPAILSPRLFHLRPEIPVSLLPLPSLMETDYRFPM